MNYDFFKDKTVLIMGLGRFGGGVDAAKFAHKAGAKVIITDLAEADELSDAISQLEELKNIEYHLGSHKESDFKQDGIIIVNPAVNPESKLLRIAGEQKNLITSQIEIFFELCRARIIGITGTNGKSTTAALTRHFLQAGSRQQEGLGYSNVWLSGNIGNEPLLTRLDRIEADDLVVLELSSFQTEQLGRIRKAPAVALITNLTANHLDRHGTFADYCAAKKNIFKYQKLDGANPAVSIFNAKDQIAQQWFEEYKDEPGRICLQFSGADVPGKFRERFSLPGRANLANLAAALCIAEYFGIEDECIIEALGEFKPLPHRLELVATIDGVGWYNDSISTTPQSAIAALEAFEAPKIIIAGGYDKNLCFGELGKEIAEKTKAAILIGQTAEKIAQSIYNVPGTNVQVEIVDSLTGAVNFAAKLAEAGDIVLLSPACASYDMFDNFQHRGRIFCDLVKTLANQ